MPKAQQFRDTDAFWDQAPDEVSYLRGANITSAGAHNRKIILHAIRARGSVLRHELAAVTGLTPPAVFKISRDLLEEGLVLIERVAGKARGQPASALRLNADAAFSLGLNVDRDHLTLVVVDFVGEVRSRFHFPMAFAAPSDVRAFFANCIDRIRTHDLVPISKLIGIGVAIPDDLGATVLPGQPGHYADWQGVDAAELLQGIINLPIVSENDAASAAIGEMLFGSGLALNSFFYVFISAGLGGGLVVNRRYVRGAHGRSGEIGFLPRINPLRKSQTNLQQTLGDVVLTATLLTALHDHGYTEASLANLGQLGFGARAIISDWVGRAADYLYLPLLTVIGTLDPDAILFGGQLPQTLNAALCREVSKRLSMHIGIHWPEMVVRPAAVSSDPAAVGAAVLAFQGVWEADIR